MGKNVLSEIFWLYFQIVKRLLAPLCNYSAFFTCQGEHWNERDALLLANLISFPHCFFSVAEGGIYHFVQEGKISAILSAVNFGSSTTCNCCSCQCNRTPAQLHFWLSPMLSRNHGTAPPPLIRSTSEGAESSCSITLPFSYTCTEANFWKAMKRHTHRSGTIILPISWGCCRNPPCAALQLPGFARALWSWHLGSPAPDTCACLHLCLLSKQFDTCSMLRHCCLPFQNPSRGHL